MDKNKIFSGYTLEIEINLNLYPYDVRMLLNSLFMSFGIGQIYSISKIVDYKDDKLDVPPEFRFLIGLADIPERKATLEYASEEFKKAETQDDKDKAQKLLAEITQSYDNNKKCFVVIKLSQTGSDILFTVTEYSRIKTGTFNMKHTYYEFDENAGEVSDDVDEFNMRQSKGANVKKTSNIPICYPKLDLKASSEPYRGIDFIACKALKTFKGEEVAPPRCLSEVKTNEFKFSAKNMTIEDFVSKLNSRKLQLKLNDTVPEILVTQAEITQSDI